MDVSIVISIAIVAAIVCGVLGFVLSGAARNFSTDPNRYDVLAGALSAKVAFTACLLVGLFLFPAPVEMTPKVHVMDLGVMKEIDPLYDEAGLYHIEGCRQVVFVTDTKRQGYFDIPHAEYHRYQDNFVAGKEYVMTYRKEGDYDRVLSFYPKN